MSDRTSRNIRSMLGVGDAPSAIRNRKPKPLSAATIKRARWLRDLCRECPPSHALGAMISRIDCAYLAEALDYAIRMSARQWKPVKP